MALERELTITYGDYHVGGATGRHVEGKVVLERNFERGAVEFLVRVEGSDASSFALECTEIERAFRKPYQDLAVAYNGAAVVSVSQGENTGFDAQPRITKEGDEGDSGRVRYYRVRVEYDLPADNVPDLGLRQRTVTVDYTPSRRASVTIRGVYTARSGNDARAEYAARVTALASAIMSALSITTYDLVREVAGPSTTNDKTLEFERVYQEIIHGQGQTSVSDDAGIVQQSLVITRRVEAPGDTLSSTTRLRTLDVRYSAALDKTVTTDPAAKWESIRSWVVTKVQDFAGGSVGVTDESISVDYDENRLTVSMVAVARVTGDRLEHRVTVADFHEAGTRLVPVWAGDPWGHFRYQGPMQYVRRISAVTRYGADRDVSFAYAEARTIRDEHQAPLPTVPGADGGQWDLVSEAADATPLVMGRLEQIRVTDVVTESVLRWFKPVQPASVTLPPEIGGGVPITP